MLSLTSSGLKASTTFPVTGVVTGDSVLSMTGTEMGATLGLDYDSTTKVIKLTGVNGAEIASISASEFVKDGMVDTVSFAENTKILTITFNTASGKEKIDVDLSALVDTYNGSNLKLTTASDFAKDTVLDTAINSLKTSIDAAAAAGVTMFGGKTGSITVRGGQTSNGSVNLTMTDNELGATIVGLGSAAYTATTDYATSTQGSKADSAVLSLRATNTGTYISVSAAKSGTTVELTPSLTVQPVVTATTSAKGLAEASDVKTYVDDQFAWEDL